MSPTDTGRLDDLQHLYRLFFQDLSICGCGSPEDAYALVRDILSLAPLYKNPGKAAELIGQPGAYHIVLSVLGNANLIEHGGSIGGSWLTPKGEHYRDLMRKYEWDDIEEDDTGCIIPAGLPHDGKGCPPTCRHNRPVT